MKIDTMLIPAVVIHRTKVDEGEKGWQGHTELPLPVQDTIEGPVRRVLRVETRKQGDRIVTVARVTAVFKGQEISCPIADYVRTLAQASKRATRATVMAQHYDSLEGIYGITAQVERFYRLAPDSILA